MLLLLLLLLLPGCITCTQYFDATAHHGKVHKGMPQEDVESILRTSLQPLFGDSFLDVTVNGARQSSLDASSISIHVSLSFKDEIKRETILGTINGEGITSDLRLLRLSAGTSSPIPSHSLASHRSSLSLFTPSSQLDATDCSGHGVLLPNATCVCDNFYVGSQCEELLCFNGIEQDGRCSCPPGRFAEHCQPQTCAPPMNDNLSMKKKSIIVALNLRSTMAKDLQYIISDLPSTISDMTIAHPDTYDNFILYTYLAFNGTIVDDVFVTSDIVAFNDMMFEVAISKGDDAQPTLRALYSTINSSPLIHPRSIILLFADSLPSDSTDWSPTEVDQTEEVQVIEQILAYGHRLVITLTDPPNDTLDPEDATFESLDRVASSVHGDLVHTSKNGIAYLTQYFTPLLHNSENVYIKSRYTCGYDSSATVEVDTSAVNYYVVFTGTDQATLKAESSDGTQIDVKPKINIQNFVVFDVDSSHTFITINTPENSAPFCSFRVFVQSSDLVLASFSHDPNIDVGFSTATQGLPHHLTFYSSQPTQSHKMQLYDMGGSAMGTTVDLNQRTDVCSFTLQADSDATCNPGSMYIKIWAANEKGQRTFTRVIPAMCERPATREPTEWTCLNGGTVIDTPEGGKACTCARLFDGAHCETPQCHNGASRNQFPTNGQPLCICAVGWAGLHCETLADCPATSEADFSADDRQFVLVVQVSFSQNYIFDDLISSLQSITTKYGSYVLVTYNRAMLNGQTRDNIDRYEFENMDGVVDQLNKVKYTYAASDKQPIAMAIKKALGNKDNRNDAIVFVLTDTDDSSIDDDIQDMKLASTQAGAPIHIIRTSQFGDTCPILEDLKIIDHARQSGGVYYDTCEKGSNAAEMSKALSTLASHPVTSQLVDAQVYYTDDCSGLSFPIKYVANYDENVYIRVATDSTIDLSVSVIRILDNVALEAKQTLALNTLQEWSLPIDKGDLSIDGFLVTVDVNKGGACGIYLYTDSTDSLWYSYGTMYNDTTSRNQYYGVAAFPRVHIQSLESSGLTPGADFYVYDLMGNMTYSSGAGELRDNCSYEVLYPDPMSCPTHGSSYLSQATISRLGTLIKRTWFTYCQMRYNYPCNQGSFIDGVCKCNSNYEGDFCEKPQCVHGHVDNDVCKCDKMYTGQFCQYGMCTTYDFMASDDERAKDFKSVTFVMELTQNALTANTMFQNGIDDLVNGIDSVGGAKQFNLITYDDDGFTMAASSSIASVFIDDFNRILDPSKYKNSKPTTTKAFAAIDQAMLLNVAQPNLIIAFISASSSFDKDQFNRMRQQHPGVQVNIIYSPTTSDPMLPGSSPYYLYEAAAYMSGGRVIPSTQIGAFNLPAAVKSMATEDVLITAEGDSDCTKGYTSTFNVESSADRLVINIMGSGVDPSTTTLKYNDNTIPYSDREELFSDNAAYIFQISKVASYGTAGTWSVKVATTSGRCTVQARVQAQLRTEIGFLSDPHSDYVKDLPFSANADKDHGSTYFALTVPTNMAKNTIFYEAKIYDFDFSTGKRTLKSTVPIGLRDYGGISVVNPGCGYQYISDPFKFTTTYSSIVVSGSDSRTAENFQRTFIVANQAQACNGNKFEVTGECSCPEGFTGDDCYTATCANGGSPSGSICLCASGYYGPHCEEIVNPNPTTTTKTTTEATTTVPTTTGPESSDTTTESTTTLPTTTTTKPICYPESTTYNILFMIENSNFNFQSMDTGSAIALAAADMYQLGTTRQQTFFMLSSVNTEFTTDGVQKSADDITNSIGVLEDSLDGSQLNKFDLGNAMNAFLTGTDIATITDSKPIAVVISGRASTDDPIASSKALVDAGYTLVGIAFTPDAQTSLLTIMDNVFLYTDDTESAQFIVNATCAVKPR